MTDYKGLIEGARSYVYPKQLDYDVIHTLASALEATLVRLQAAEKVCEAVENMRDVSLDLKTALGLEHKVHEALDAWREAKTS